MIFQLPAKILASALPAYAETSEIGVPLLFLFRGGCIPHCREPRGVFDKTRGYEFFMAHYFAEIEANFTMFFSITCQRNTPCQLAHRYIRKCMYIHVCAQTYIILSVPLEVQKKTASYSKSTRSISEAHLTPRRREIPPEIGDTEATTAYFRKYIPPRCTHGDILPCESTSFKDNTDQYRGPVRHWALARCYVVPSFGEINFLCESLEYHLVEVSE